MSVIANGAGVVTGSFTVPTGVPAGSKKVQFFGSGGKSGEAIFTGRGTLVNRTFQETTDTFITFWQQGVDPLAQTFMMDENTQVTGVDLWFTAASTTLTNIQIRETIAGFPGPRVLCSKTIKPSDIVVGGAPTRILFDAPTLLLGDAEYAIVVLCGDPIGALSVAEIGKFDATAQKWITSQPYSIGVLLSSSNASTWTAHQDRDMTFQLLDANFTQTQRDVAIGTVAVTAAPDLILLAVADRPDSATSVQYELTMPDTSVIVVAAGQPVQLPAPVTGNVAVKAVLKGNAKFSPVLYPGSQLVVGHVSTSATYVSRAIPGGASVKVKTIYEAFVPSGATVTAQYKGPDVGDVWTALPQTATRAVDDGFIEFTHEVTGVNELSVQIKLILSGTTAARPRVRDLRTFVM